MNSLYNLARVRTATTGTGTITLAAAVSGFLTFAQAGVPDAAVVTYGIQDGVNSEIGIGTYTLSGTTLSRDTILRSTGAGNNTAISLSDSAQVFITPSAEDFKGTTGSIFFASSTGFLGQDNANLFWNDTNNRLGIGNALPAVALDVGATASAFRVRNLFTDASNGEWFEASWASDVLSLGTNKNGSGLARNIQVVVGGASVLDYGVTNTSSWTSGNLYIGSGSAGSGANTYLTILRTAEQNGDVIINTFNAGGGSAGSLLLNTTYNLPITVGTGLFRFGGSTASFPAIKRSSIIAQFRLADDSAYAPLEADILRTATAYTVETLPAAGTAGRRAYVTNALTSTYGAAVAGGGAVVCPVFDNGTAWVVG